MYLVGSRHKLREEDMAIPTALSSSSPLLLVFLLLSSYPPHSSSTACDKDDSAALLRVKQQLGNPSELSSWLPATSCCNWLDVNCADTGRVDSLFIIDIESSTTVTVPPAIGDLTAIRVVQIVNFSRLTGPIPPSFAKLTNLEVLEISSTSLSGSIPAGLLSHYTNLSNLVFSNNKLSGPIPPALSKLVRLNFIAFDSNELSGAIPPGLLHGSQRFLILSRNKLTGEIPQSYGEADFHTIDLSHNQLTGDPSALFGTAKKVNTIDLSWNRFKFDLTHAMLPHYLNTLDLRHNQIQGGVPKSLRDLYSLFNLNLTDNELCGEIPRGRAMDLHGADSYLHNKCLCGTPLPPCRKTMLK